nr:hypothetical protein [uncultured bacterium]
MNNLSKYCLALDLQNEPDKTSVCIAHKKYTWTEVLDILRGSGIIISELFNSANRLDNVKLKVQLWKALMISFQQKLPNTKSRQK